MTGRKLIVAVLALASLLPAGIARANEWSTADYDLYAGDFNNDGRSDILYVAKASDKASGIALSNGSGPNITHQTWASNYLGITWYGNYYKPVVGDFNGDGRDDVFMQRQTPGDHYVLLTQSSGADVNKLTAIAQTVPNSHMSLVWSADQHVIKAGDFNGDGRSDLVLQGRGPLATHAIVGPTSAGQFTGTALQTWSEWFLGFKWSTTASVLHVGDFNGDGRADLFMQARPGFAIVDTDRPFPTPAYRPDSYAILLAKTTGSIFQLSSIQQTWDHNYLGANWSPLFANVLVGDFDGNGRDDLLLQAKRSGQSSFWLPADAAAQFTSIYTMATNVAWSADVNRLIVANFDGGAVVGVYLQSQVSGTENQIAHIVTGTSVSLSTHIEESLASAVPGTAVGAIGGEFSVDPSGGANYQVPIWTPPGVAGMKPEISLAYSSRAGNGLVGKGWLIGGLSAITRCGTVWELDGISDGVNFDSSDKFCLDGQRLVPISGTYGNLGVEYRTEIQSFQKVTSVGGVNGDPGSFTVWTKSGQIIDYGATGVSRVEAQGKTQALVWAVQRIRDRYDNFIEYIYEEVEAQSSYRPLTIKYGNKNNAIVGRIEFIYETRTDTSSGYIAGSVSGMDKRLKQIEVYARPSPNDILATVGVRTYYLNYETSPVSSQSHLKSIIECDGPSGFSQRCLGASTVAWQHGYRGFSSQITTTVGVSSNANLKPGDINGDGRLDFALTSGSTWRYRMGNLSGIMMSTGLTARDADKALLMDWNNDGYQDVVQKGPGSNPNLEVIIGTYSGLSASAQATTLSALIVTGGTASTGDFNGDGRQDIQHEMSVRLNGTSSIANGTTVDFSPPPPVPLHFDPYWSRLGKPVVVNFDGDGRDDVIVSAKECYMNQYDVWTCGPTRLVLFSFNPSSGQMYPIWWTSAPITQSIKPIDANGDGLTDILSYESGNWKLRLATGNPGNAYVSSWAASLATYEQYTDVDWNDFDQMLNGESYAPEPAINVSLTQLLLDQAEIVDYNKDGRTDVLIAHSGYWRVLIANGAGFDSRLLTTERTVENAASAAIVDENSDGVPDLLYAGSSYYKIMYGRGPSVTGVVERITDGLGAVTTIQYGVTTDPIVYKGHASHVETLLQPVFPYAHLGAPLPVVTRFNTDNGRTGGIYTSYEYRGLKVHKQGRGLLGFSEIKAWNDASDIQTVNQYFQTYPYTGMIAIAEQRLPNTLQFVGDTSPDILLNYQSMCDTDPDCPSIRPAVVTMTPANVVTKTTNTVTHLTYSFGSKFPHVRMSEDWHYPLLTSGGAQPAAWKYSKTEYLNATGGTSAVYDDYGNPYRIKVTVHNGAGTPGDVHTVETQNFFTNDAPNWILGRLKTAKVTHTRPTYAGSGNLEDVSVVRVSSFDYSATTGVLIEETTEPATYTDPQSGGPTTNTNGTNLWLKKAYEYDVFGNRKKETVTGADIGTRISQVTFDGQGQFPVTVTNALNHGEAQAWDTRFGVQTSVEGPNSLTTTWLHDSFGRRTMEFAPQSSIWTATDRYWCSSALGCTDSRAIFAIRKLSSAGGYEWTEHDRLGRAVRGRKAMFDGREAYQDKYFDPLGREYLASGPYFPGETRCYNFQKFDALGRVIEQWSPATDAGCATAPWEYNAATPSGGRTVHTQHDEIAPGGAGRITTVTTNLGDATARVMTKQTNVMDRLRFAKDFVSGAAYATTEFDYEPVGNTSWVKDAALNETDIFYDPRGFKTSMVDPDMGTWVYTYNVLGELKTQTDAKGQITTLDYDLLGRMFSRIEKTDSSTTETTTTWTYDDTVMGGPKAIGKLTKAVVAANGSAGATGYEENYVYDSAFGYLADVKRRINNEWHWISQTYDALGRLNVLKYPNSVSASSQSSAGSDSQRLQIRHNYNVLGYLESTSDVTTGTVYWKGEAINSAGALTKELLGNGLTTLQTIDRATGTLEVLTTGPGVSATVQNLEFDWDKAANLKVRRDLQANKREEFDYDGLYRMTQSRLYATVGGGTASATDNYAYNAIGNLTGKGGAVGAHTYSAYDYGARTGCTNTVVRPHAVYQVNAAGTVRRYCYDGNGNVSTVSRTSGSGPIIYDATTWWVANLTKRISQGGSAAYSDFWYGPGRERIQQTAKKSASVTETTLYVGGAYEKVTRGATIEHVHYIRGGGDTVAIQKKIVGGTTETRYLHRDHLGSVVAATDYLGAVFERYSFDPWGKRRDPSTWVTPAIGTFSFDPAFNDRGFTGHEHIDHLGLVNMNGRVYDPEIGRFLSADPFVQFPESTQGYNRYTYVGNNPLSYIDPSGFSFLKKLMKIVGIAMSIWMPQFSYWWQQALWTFASGYLQSGGNLKAGLLAVATMGMRQTLSGLPRGPPAGTTPPFNPNGFSARVTDAATRGAERSSQSQLKEFFRRSIRVIMSDDAGRATNGQSKVESTSSPGTAWERLLAIDLHYRIASSAYSENDSAAIKENDLRRLELAVNTALRYLAPKGTIHGVDTIIAYIVHYHDDTDQTYYRGTSHIDVASSRFRSYTQQELNSVVLHEIVHAVQSGARGRQGFVGAEYSKDQRGAYQMQWDLRAHPDFELRLGKELWDSVRIECQNYGGCKK